MSLKDEWKDLEDAIVGVENSGDDITVKPLNLMAHQIIKNEENKVDKEDGKSLSSNDFTDEYKEKLDGLRSQIQSDWQQNDETQPDYIKNRPFYEEVVELGEGDRYADDMPIKLSEPLQNGDIVYYECHWQDGTESVGSEVCEIDVRGIWTFCDNRLSYYSKDLELKEGIYHWFGDYEGNASHIKISKLKAIPLLEKYIPDTIARTEEVNAKIGDISTMLDELHTYAQGLVVGGEA